MAEPKMKFSPWLITVVLGVITILFSFYAFQQQAQDIEDEKEIDRLKSELTECVKQSEELRLKMMAAMDAATKAKEEAEQVLIKAREAESKAQSKKK